MKKTILSFLLLALSGLILISCNNSLPIEEDLSNKDYKLINQDSVKVDYPEVVKGKIAVIGYIFTNCPSICPLTTNNMRLIQEKVKKEGLKNVEFVSISFDPDYDSPEVLKDYADVRNLDLSNWMLLTGNKKEIKKVTNDVGVVVAVSDSSTLEDGRKIYYYVHTDRISLMDPEGRIRKDYHGSTANIDEVVEDIKKLEN